MGGKMTPKAQAVLAAEILGWTDLGIRTSDIESQALHGTPPNTTHKPGAWVVPDFYTDANTSLMLVEWMEKKGWELESTLRLGLWSVTFIKLRGPKFDYSITVSASTFPLAVLGAFLKANGKETK